MVAARQKKRGKVTRFRTKLVVIGAEGRNKTEKLYFMELFRNNKSYRVKFPTSTDTDPVRIVQAAVQYIRDEEIDQDNGDLVFCVVDTDTDPRKQNEINKAVKIADKHQVKMILSNPCFEIWFLQHYKYSTRSFATSDEVIRELKNHIPDYKKNVSVYAKIKDKQSDAIENAGKLEKYHEDLGRKKYDMECNPSTEVYKIVDVK